MPRFVPKAWPNIPQPQCSIEIVLIDRIPHLFAIVSPFLAFKVGQVQHGSPPHKLANLGSVTFATPAIYATIKRVSALLAAIVSPILRPLLFVLLFRHLSKLSSCPCDA